MLAGHTKNVLGGMSTINPGFQGMVEESKTPPGCTWAKMKGWQPAWVLSVAHTSAFAKCSSCRTRLAWASLWKGKKLRRLLGRPASSSIPSFVMRNAIRSWTTSPDCERQNACAV